LVNPFLTLDRRLADRLPTGDTIIPFISPHADFLPQFDPFHFVHFSLLSARDTHGRGVALREKINTGRQHSERFP